MRAFSECVLCAVDMSAQLRLLAAAVILAFVGQSDDELAKHLKREGWKAVESLIVKGESQRAGLQAAAKSSDPDVAFFAGAAIAELDAAKEGDKALLISTPPELGLKAPTFSLRRIHSWIEQMYRLDVNQFDPGPAQLLQFSGRILPNGPLAVSRRATVEVIEAVDERGNRLEVPKNNPGYMGQGHELYAPGVRYGFDLVSPPGDVKVAKRIRLRVHVACERKREIFVFRDLGKAAEQEKKAGVVAVKLIGPNPSSAGEYQVNIEVTAPAGHPLLDPGDPWKPTEFALMGANGIRWNMRGQGSTVRSDTKVYTFHFRDPGGAGPPESVIFPAITETYTRMLYLEFREVPLK